MDILFIYAINTFFPVGLAIRIITSLILPPYIPFLDSQVSVDFSEKQKRPGEKTKIVMKAKPGSRVAISALDKSVLLLKNADEVKKSKVRK